MIIVSLYRKEDRNGKVYIRTDKEPICPICSSALRVIGSRERKVIEMNGNRQSYVIRRLRCKNCETVHHELPDLLIPYKRHCANTIEQIIAKHEPFGVATTPQSNTVRRVKQWWNVVEAYFWFIVGALEARLGCALNIIPRPRTLVRAAVNSHNWVHTRSVVCSLGG